MATLIHRLLDGFLTLKAARQPASYLSRIALVGSIRSDLDNLELSLSPAVGRTGVPADGTLPTGICKCSQYQALGLLIV